MLAVIALVLILLWLLGLIFSFTFGGLIHILLVVGIIMLIVKLIKKA
jgi:hypothetical protein